ncbi:death-inducer obliterator 1 isoform X3 [Trichogramma pretiosum]|uniref:death-inducer obliterator 1 isoform X3 n=1 Tax=Trichogramma pretiosum TaxID=7493 RepID=UPI000C71932E|nr:death-inducer obliterator 1 isoform X3 [Trichogramma pretiosum]
MHKKASVGRKDECVKIEKSKKTPIDIRKMSNSFVMESPEGVSKKDDTLILMVNDNGVISVDQDTLQNLIINQTNANVSVVRMTQTSNDISEGNLTLTVDPPSYVPPENSANHNATDSSGLLDPLMQMDPEQLERLETALQSEEAKKILGENVTAMLDMLTVEEQQNNIRYAIELDHCYTNKVAPAETKSTDSMLDMNSSNTNNAISTDKATASMLMPVSSINANNSSPVPPSVKSIASPPKIVKQPVSTSSRLRRASTSMTPVATAPKVSTGKNQRAALNSSSSEVKNNKDVAEVEDESLFSLSESSEQTESDNDSDFGARTSRKTVRSRGGRRGLTTRGGSTSSSRRRGSNKLIDNDQMRRLSTEMSAAVNSMNNPESEITPEKSIPAKTKKTLKTMGGKIKEEVLPSVPIVKETPVVETNLLQTTNQVKANLISANMFKGDMILTKPGADRNNQKIVIVQKHIAANLHDSKNIIKKQVMLPKDKLILSNSKVPILKEIKTLTTPVIVKEMPSNVQHKALPTEVQNVACTSQNITIPQKIVATELKMKPMEIKKEKKKLDSPVEVNKPLELPKPEIKIQSGAVQKKPLKKEHRKSDSLVVDALGPALFSTPDIIRRVGSNNDMKVSESFTSSVSTSSATSTVTNHLNTNSVTSTTSSEPTAAVNIPMETFNATNILKGQDMSLNDSENIGLPMKPNSGSSISDPATNAPINEKMEITDLLQPTLDSSGIDSDEHLLATLGMEAEKQLPKDEVLLAEALILQETLGVDLDHSELVDPHPEAGDSLLPDITETSISTITAELSNSEVDTSLIASVSTPSTPISSAAEPSGKKVVKEARQIIRGGRVITLPPIEAPATRSKKLQAKVDVKETKCDKMFETDTPQKQNSKLQSKKTQQQTKMDESIKTDRTMRTPSQVSLQKKDMIYDMSDDYGGDGDGGEEEDDPNKLWCICRQPHNNRFMICCDICEEWFHGKCVHVTTAMDLSSLSTGEEMEKKGIEWVCPNCKAKKNEENKAKSTPRRRKSSSDTQSNQQSVTPSPSNPNVTTPKQAHHSNTGKNVVSPSGGTQCVVCKKEARKASIYCSDACILVHAESMKEKSGTPQIKTTKIETPKIKPEAKIIVYQKSTGKILKGASAPTSNNLKTWLKEHPSYEVVNSNNLSTIQIKTGGKNVATIQPAGSKINKISPGKPTNQTTTKMVFTKIPGTKQTVITAADVKKVDSPQSRISTPLQRPDKVQANAATPSRISTPNARSANVKTPQSSQKLPATSTPKVTSSKKIQEPKASTSQQHQSPGVSQQTNKVVTKTPQVKKPTEPENLRITIRKTLAEMMLIRIKETSDLKLSEEEVNELVLQIELELLKFFKDTGAKYKAQYRRLLFNIKDPKNLTLFRKIADRSISPEALVKLSPEEMASQELAEWRENETKHQLEMIKKNELDMMAQAKSIVLKSHKGEQIIESKDNIPTVQEIETALDTPEVISSTVPEPETKAKVLPEEERRRKEKDRERERRRSHSRDKSTRRKHSHDRDRSKSSKKHKDRDREKDHDKSSRKKDKEREKKRKRSHSRSHKDRKHRRDDKGKELPEKSESGVPTATGSNVADKSGTEEPRLWKHIEDEPMAMPQLVAPTDGNESDLSDREPSSTVTIHTPDITEQQRNEAAVVQTVWKGCVYMKDVAKFHVTAQNVSRNSKELLEEVPDSFEVVGRINPATVWDYIGKMKKNYNKEIIVIKLTAINDEEKIPYITLYSYLDSRNRLGVLGNVSPFVKDFYIMPLSHGSQLPSVLLPLEPPGLVEDGHLLLGIIVANNRRKRQSVATTPVPTKMLKTDRSYTPPPSTPSSSGHDLALPMSSELMNSRVATAVKQSPIASKTPQADDSITAFRQEDDDEPYSPGAPVDLNLDDEGAENSKSSESNPPSTELERKMEELSRQIEEKKMQIQNISSSFLNESSITLPGLGLDPPESAAKATEAYSPTDTGSFTPPPQGILEKVSNITIPADLQEILANVKRQESTKAETFLPKPGATFLTSPGGEGVPPALTKTASTDQLLGEVQSSSKKETKSTLSSLSDYDIMKKAEEELAAMEMRESSSGT